MDRKVIIIDKDRIGIFNLKDMKIDENSLSNPKLSYEIEVEKDTVLKSRNLRKKIEKLILRRRKYEGKDQTF